MIDTDHATPALLLTVENSGDSACVLSDDSRLLQTSKGWKSFAENNGGLDALRRWPLGSRTDEALPACLLGFYRAAYQSALATGERWEHDYECSSPSKYRKFRMFVYPVEGSRLLIVHSLVVETPHAWSREPHDDEHTTDGIVTMCANCRRTFNPGASRWDWVSSYVERMPPSTSHGLCPSCLEFYYPV